MQEDKEPTFDAFRSLELAIAAMTGMVTDMMPNAKAMQKAAGSSYSTATDLADWLVRTLQVPFREAHEITGRIVVAAEAAGVALEKLPLAEMQAIAPRIGAGVYDVLGARQSVKSRVSYGGTAPENVRRQARRWLKLLARQAE
jgi:argininosuccinate lyase